MKSKTHKVKRKKAFSSNDGTSFQVRNSNIFNEDNLPKHHYNTVKEWIMKFTEETILFTKSLEKKIAKVKEENLFDENDTCTLDSINLVISKFYKIIEKSLNGLCDFRTNIDEYISTWNVVLKDGLAGESSDSSEIEYIASFTPENSNQSNIVDNKIDETNPFKPEVDLLNTDISKCHSEADKKSGENEEENNVVGRIRIRNPSEVNKLAGDVSDSTNKNSSMSADVKSHDQVNSDLDCVLCSNDEDSPIVINSCEETSPEKKSTSVKSHSSVPRKKHYSSCSSGPDVPKSSKNTRRKFSMNQKHEDVLESSSENTNMLDANTKANGNKSEKEENNVDNNPRKSERQNKITWDTSKETESCHKFRMNQEHENVLESSSENTNMSDAKTKDNGIKNEKEDNNVDNNPQKPERQTKINWDTSTETESTDRDWINTSKNKRKKKESETKKKKKLLSRRERRSRMAKGDFSSSDDGIARLCNLNSLKKRSHYSSDSGVSEKKTKRATKKPKKEEITLMDCYDSNASLSSVVSDDFKVDIMSKLKSLNTDYEPRLDDFGKVVTDSDDTIPVLSDSSLDSIFDQLTEQKQKISRSKSSKKSDKEKKQSNQVPRRRDKLLETKLTDTSSYEEEQKWEKHKMKTKIQSSDSEEEVIPKKMEPKKSRQSKNSLKAQKNLFSDSDVSISDSEESAGQEKSEEEKDKDSEEEKTPENKKKRKRIQRHSDSSDSDGEPTPNKSDGKGRRNIRKVLKEDSLEKSTKEALKEEEERKRRIAEKQKLYNTLVKKKVQGEDEQALDELVLDFDLETKEPLVSVNKDLVKKLKPHQAEGIKFMWDSCFESVKVAKEGKGAGCILAHCMGLGKTLQVITLIHTLLTSDQVDIKRVLVVCPLSTVQNWVNEFRKWLKDIGSGEDIEIYDMIKTAVNHRSYQLRDWERTGGVLVLGYNMFRSLVQPKGRVKGAIKKAVEETLIDPGPDVVVCDEGHILKNEKTAIAKAMSKIKSKRRIVLTGTPLQNNLVEYHCMVQFIMPNLLGTRKEFQNRFVHPIQNGQFEDSTERDVKVMKRRAHVLHKMLDGIVQRKDYNVLTPYLPPKFEYVIHVKLTEVQCKLYRHYLDNFARKNKNEGGGLFQDFQHLLRICTHPRSLLLHSDKEFLKKEYDEDSEGSLKDFIDDGSDSDASSTSSSSSSSKSGSDKSDAPPRRKNTRSTRASGMVSDEEIEIAPKRTEWWSDLVTEEELQDIKSSSKLFLFFTILKHCEEIGDKLLVFSQSLYTLDLIEHFLELIEENSHKDDSEKIPSLSGYSMSSWDKGIDYFRLDGGTSSDSRANWCKQFNHANNTRGRLFLISTRAGGLGINLTGANRVIIFDASWNPSFDVQSIFRVFRFGQEKPCYIYRLLSKGTMEEKIYERQVAKLSTSLRVIDEQQIDRHFTQTSLAELYAFNPDEPETRETPILPKDRLMAELIQSYSDIIIKHHQHDSLLENIEGEELNEDERKAAWLEFENEKNHVPPPTTYINHGGFGFINANNTLQTTAILNSLVEKIRNQNPSFSEEIIKQKALEVIQQMPYLQAAQMQMQMYNSQGQMPFVQQAPQQMPFNNIYQQQLLQRQQFYQQQFRAPLQMQQQVNQFAKLNQLASASSNRARINMSTAGKSSDAAVSNGVKNGSGSQPQMIEIQDDE